MISLDKPFSSTGFMLTGGRFRRFSKSVAWRIPVTREKTARNIFLFGFFCENQYLAAMRRGKKCGMLVPTDMGSRAGQASRLQIL